MDFKLAITIQKRELGVTVGRSVGRTQFTVNRGQKDTQLCQVSDIWGHRVLHNIHTM